MFNSVPKAPNIKVPNIKVPNIKVPESAKSGEIKSGKNLNPIFNYDRALMNRAKSLRLFQYNEEDGNDIVPICRAVLGNNYGYTVTNTWGGSSGFIDKVINMLSDNITSRTGKMASDAISTIGDATGINWVKRLGDFGQNLTNSHIFSSSELVKTFKGTSVDFDGVENIEFMLISDTSDYDINVDLKKLNDISVGDLWDPKAERTDKDDWEFVTSIQDLASTWIGIQRAPNGHQVDYDKGYKDKITGSLNLAISDFMLVENLLIKELKVSASSQKVMRSGALRPLYAKVTLSFEFGRMVTKFDLEKLFR